MQRFFFDEAFLGPERPEINIDAGSANVQVVVNHTLVIAPGTLGGATIIERIEGEWSSLFPNPLISPPSLIDNDVIFTVKEIPHEIYERVGSNLIHKPISISLDEALSGFMFNATHVDGRILRMQCDEVITPTTEFILEGEGMPMYMGMLPSCLPAFMHECRKIQKKTHQGVNIILIGKGRGCMTFTFNIVFPTHITGQLSLEPDIHHLHSKKEERSCRIQ